jgi:WD40 repeat protein
MSSISSENIEAQVLTEADLLVKGAQTSWVSSSGRSVLFVPTQHSSSVGAGGKAHHNGKVIRLAADGQSLESYRYRQGPKPGDGACTLEGDSERVVTDRSDTICSLSISSQGESLLVTTHHGKIFVANTTSALASGGDGNPHSAKRSRTEADSKASPSSSSSARWRACELPRSSTWGGGPCWVGAEWMPSTNDIVATNEFAKVISLIDHTTLKETSVRGTEGFPTSLNPLSERTVAVAEGKRISIWDLRMSGARSAVQRTFGRSAFTSLGFDSVKMPHVVASADEDRSVCFWDVRKWTTPKAKSGLLKYSIRSIAILSGKEVVVGGIDTEARVVSSDPDTTPSSKKEEKAAAGGDCDASGLGAPCATGDTTEGAAVQGVGAFRQRITEAVHCTGGWRGGWYSPPGVSVAVASSIANELYIAC